VVVRCRLRVAAILLFHILQNRKKYLNKFSCFLKICDSIQNGSGAHLASYPTGTRGFSPGGKAAGA
jgi:hypothetical protein